MPDNTQNMVRIFYWVIGLCIVVAVIGLYVFMNKAPSGSSPAPTTGTGFPQNQTYTSVPASNGSSGGDNQEQITVSGYGGVSITVKDFIRNGETVSDPVNTGNYYLAGPIGYCLGDGTCPEGAKADGFTASYNPKGTYFKIMISAEPIKDKRVAAEQFLMSRLGIGEAEMCLLNYYVSVVDELNPIYAGANLGFSFCPGATQL